MKHDIFAKWLKVVIAGVVLIGLACCVYIIPQMSKIYSNKYPEFISWVIPWKIVLYVCAVPCFIAMVLAWMIASNIQKDKSFCIANAKLFKAFSFLALGDSVFLGVASVVLWLLGYNHPGLLFVQFLIVFIGLAIYVCSAALSYFVAKAASLQEENDLTI